MIHRRGIVGVLLLLAIVVFGGMLQLVRASATTGTAGALPPVATATPSPAASATGRAVIAAIARVERAFDAGDVGTLCRPGALVDPAVVHLQDRHAGGCQGELETLVAHEAPFRLTVLDVVLRPGLATAVVRTRPGTTVSVDLIRRRERWLLSFSDGDDPMPALAGTT